MRPRGNFRRRAVSALFVFALVALLAAGPIAEVALPDAASSIDKDLIRRVIRAHLDEVRACYAEGLARDPALAGRVVIHFTIATSGKVTESRVSESDLGDAAVGQCIAEAALGWRFVGGAQIAVSYPFVLTPNSSRTSSMGFAVAQSSDSFIG